MDEVVREKLAQAYAFLGNSLLRPVTQTADVGLDPVFWEAFPTFGDEGVAHAVRACAEFAHEARVREAAGGGDAALAAAVEHTRLFVGPPSPAAPPWETFHRAENVTMGFGRATFEMRETLRSLGLEVRNENNQYEDHIGIELLCLSEICRRRGAGASEDVGGEGAPGASAGAGVAGAPAGASATAPPSEARFLDERVLGWLPSLRAAVAKAAPGGYCDRLLAVVEALASWHRRELEG